MALDDPTLSLQKLYDARDQLIQRILDVTSKPKPNYEIDGQKVDWADYLDQLQKSLTAQNRLIQDMGDLFEEKSTWYI